MCVCVCVCVCDAQERETYRWPVKESLKSMLALGWSIERTKEGEALFQQRESEKLKKSAEVPARPPVLIVVLFRFLGVFLFMIHVV